MAQRKPILPPGYPVEQEPTPLEPRDLRRLTEWIISLDDPYMPAYCLHWGFGIVPEQIQQYIGDDGIQQKIGAFPNLCRRHLRKGARTVIGFEDLHHIFTGILSNELTLLLLTPTRALWLGESNRLAYLVPIYKLQEEHRQREIAFLNKHPSLKSERRGLPEDMNIDYTAIADTILALPEDYERCVFLHFIQHKRSRFIAQELNIDRVKGIIEYCRRLLSRQLGFTDPLDDKSMSEILSNL